MIKSVPSVLLDMDLSGLTQAMGVVSILAGITSLYAAFAVFWQKMKVEDTPTSKVRSLAAGLVELKGRAVPREAFIAPFSKRRCVLYDYREEELRVRREWDPMTRKSITVREWATVRTESKAARFYLEDATGRVLVDPKGADVEGTRVFHEPSVPRRRHTERAIACNSIIYILGTAAENPEKPFSGTASDAIMIRKGDAQKDFIITPLSEGQVVWGYRIRFAATLLSGMVLLALGGWLLFIYAP